MKKSKFVKNYNNFLKPRLFLFTTNNQSFHHVIRKCVYLVAQTVALMIPTATVCLISRTAKRPRGG